MVMTKLNASAIEFDIVDNKRICVATLVIVKDLIGVPFLFSRQTI